MNRLSAEEARHLSDTNFIIEIPPHFNRIIDSQYNIDSVFEKIRTQALELHTKKIDVLRIQITSIKKFTPEIKAQMDAYENTKLRELSIELERLGYSVSIDNFNIVITWDLPDQKSATNG